MKTEATQSPRFSVHAISSVTTKVPFIPLNILELDHRFDELHTLYKMVRDANGRCLYEAFDRATFKNLLTEFIANGGRVYYIIKTEEIESKTVSRIVGFVDLLLPSSPLCRNYAIQNIAFEETDYKARVCHGGWVDSLINTILEHCQGRASALETNVSVSTPFSRSESSYQLALRDRGFNTCVSGKLAFCAATVAPEKVSAEVAETDLK